MRPPFPALDGNGTRIVDRPYFRPQLDGSSAKDMCCDAVSAYSIRSSYIRELSQQRAPPRERIASGLWVMYSSQQVGSVCTSNSASVPCLTDLLSCTS